MSGRGGVLLVEDEPMIATMLVGFLEDEGYDVTCHTSAADAVTCILSGRKHFDALITDVDLKDRIDGFDIAALLHKQQTSLATIFMSGEVAATVKKQAPACAIVLEKPFRPSEVADALGCLLGSSGSRLGAAHGSL